MFHWQFIITYIFSISLKFREGYITGQWCKYAVKNATLHLHIRSWHFLLVFVNKFVFLSFSCLFFSFFDKISNFCNRMLTNQGPEQKIVSETVWKHWIEFSYINPFYSNIPFLHPLKRSENQRFCNVFKGYRNGSLRYNGLVLID